ncbi:MAG TPA: peptidoglycan-binding protein [Tetrasphaera sp.]|nr:peptidoglycan-binding protein [Tetrasphaera sp.]
MSTATRRLIAPAVVTALAVPTIAAAAVPPPPKPPVTLPSAVDVSMPYEGQGFCELVTRPGVADFAKTVSTHYSRTDYHTVRTCLGDVSEHYDGRALDWMLSAYDPKDKAIADSVTKWLTQPVNGVYGANARRLGIMYIIWNGKTWKSYRNPETWTTYTGAVPHTDHIHFSFAWDGACKRTSWWTGKALTTVSMAKCGSSNGPLVSVETEFTQYKDTLLMLGSKGDAVVLAQQNLGVPADGDFGPITRSAVINFQKKWKLDVTGRVNKGVWNQMERLQYPLIKYRSTTVLRKGMSGGQAIKDAQRALRITQDGIFGSGMEAAVKRIQGKYRLAQTGVIRPLTWAALDEELRSRMRQAEFDAGIDKAAAEVLLSAIR